MKKPILFLVALILLGIVGWVLLLAKSSTRSSSATAPAPSTAPVPASSAENLAPPPPPAPIQTQPAESLPVSQDQIKAFVQAVDQDDVDLVRSMLAEDLRLANSEFRSDGRWPLHYLRSLEMAQLLIEYGASTDSLDTQCQARPIRWAVERSVSNHDQMMKVADYLVEVGGADNDLAYFVATGDTDELKILLANNPDLAKATTTRNDVLGSGYSMINLAAKFNHAEVAELLLAHGADVNSRGGEFYDANALEYAAWAGNTQVVKVLIDHKVDVNAKIHAAEQGDHTALWWAALTGRKEVVKLLVEAGAIVDPALVEEVEKSKIHPYFGRNLPPQEDYDAVIKLLNDHITH